MGKEPEVYYYGWAMDEDIAFVHSKNLERGREFKVEIDEIVYDMAVSNVVENVADDVKENVSDDHDIAVAGVITSREKGDIETFDPSIESLF